MKPSIIQDIDGFDETLREIATIDARVAVYEAARQEEILVAEGRFKARTETSLGRRALLAEQLELYYRAHRAELEKGKKSIELQFGTAGIKVSAPSLQPLKGWNWDKVLVAMRGGGSTLKKFIRSKETVDKAALKSAKLSADALLTIGVKVRQTENFWFETKPVSLKREDAA